MLSKAKQNLNQGLRSSIRAANKLCSWLLTEHAYFIFAFVDWQSRSLCLSIFISLELSVFLLFLSKWITSHFSTCHSDYLLAPSFKPHVLKFANTCFFLRARVTTQPSAILDVLLWHYYQSHYLKPFFQLALRAAGIAEDCHALPEFSNGHWNFYQARIWFETGCPSPHFKIWCY